MGPTLRAPQWAFTFSLIFPISSVERFLLRFYSEGLGTVVKADIVNPFIETVRKLAEILGIDRFEKEKITVNPKPTLMCDVSAIVHVGGASPGVVILGLSSGLAAEMVSRAYGDDVHTLDESEDRTSVEGMMEMIVENASREMARVTSDNVSFHHAVTFVKGSVADGLVDGPWLSIAFLTGAGKFVIQAGVSSGGG
jgi:CheY-specific phosphatase CheX